MYETSNRGTTLSRDSEEGTLPIQGIVARKTARLAEVKLMFVEVKKAQFSARCDKEAHVKLLDDFEEHVRYAQLRSWLCGKGKAASVWEDGNSRTLTTDGFKEAGQHGSESREDGDDFTFAGTESELSKIK